MSNYNHFYVIHTFIFLLHITPTTFRHTQASFTGTHMDTRKEHNLLLLFIFKNRRRVVVVDLRLRDVLLPVLRNYIREPQTVPSQMNAANHIQNLRVHVRSILMHLLHVVSLPGSLLSHYTRMNLVSVRSSQTESQETSDLLFRCRASGTAWGWFSNGFWRQ